MPNAYDKVNNKERNYSRVFKNWKDKQSPLNTIRENIKILVQCLNFLEFTLKTTSL